MTQWDSSGYSLSKLQQGYDAVGSLRVFSKQGYDAVG